VNNELAHDRREARHGLAVPPPALLRQPVPPAADPTPAPPAAPRPPTPAAAEVVLPPPHSWLRRLGRTERAMHYNRLIALVLAVNAWLAVGAVRDGLWAASSGHAAGHVAGHVAGHAIDGLARLVVGNLAVAVLIRQHYVINLLFWLATRAPTTWPLSIRWTLAKVYHFGGIHVGGSIAATLWFAALVGTLGVQLARGTCPVSATTLAVAVAILAVLVGICVTARPSYRQRRHDRFERIHRLGGWSSLLLFWGLTVSLTADLRGDTGLAAALVGSTSTWLLCLVTFSVALPWLRLKKVAIDIVRPSSHCALTRFDHGVTPFAGSSTALSRHPLLEWHSFANIPEPGRPGFRLAISRSGDWTGSLIDDAPSHIWVKGIPTAGVANIEVLFKRVIYVATGSGIGPCLPHLLACEVPSRLVWSTRSPRRTYGDALLGEILAVQPDPIIWDTDERGTPDLVKLAYQAYREFDAEAVICIANKKLTWRVVEAMEARGIPAYGAIWDS
jgi:hypothetical protein